MRQKKALLVIKAYSTEPFADPRYISGMTCYGGYRLEEIKQFDEQNVRFCSPLTVKILDFLFHYKDGALAPDKWDYNEPMRRIVDEDTLPVITDHLSYPGHATLLLKRIRSIKNDVKLSNESHGPRTNPATKYNDDGILFFHTDTYPSYVTIWGKWELDEAKEIIRDLAQCIGADYGCIKDSESQEILYDVQRIPYDALFGFDSRYNVICHMMVEWVKAYNSSSEKAFCSDFKHKVGESNYPLRVVLFDMLETICRHIAPGVHCALLIEPISRRVTMEQLLNGDETVIRLITVNTVVSRQDVRELYSDAGCILSKLPYQGDWYDEVYCLQTHEGGSIQLLYIRNQ